MTREEYAGRLFREISDDSPANGCRVTESGDLAVLDMGLRETGGWTSAKKMLEALTGGRGIVTVTRDLRGIHQFPAVEILYDDPVEAASLFETDENGLIGVREGERYAFCVTKELKDRSGLKGQVAVTGRASLASAVLEAARALPEAVGLLLESGVPEEAILWAWSFSPVADLSLNPDVLKNHVERARNRRAVSIWVRDDDERLKAIAEKFSEGTLRLHNLATARTLLKEGPEKVINVNH